MAAQTPATGCARHPGMGFVYICLDCNEELICIRCMVDTHNGHRVVVIDDVVSDKKGKLQQYMDKLSNVVNPCLQREITQTEGKIKENSKQFREMIANIRDQSQKMKHEIDNYADNLIQLCCELEKMNKEMLKSYKSALVSLKDENNRKIEDCQQALDTGTIRDVMEKAKQTKRTSIPPVPGTIKNVQFHPGPISVSQIQHSLGFLTVDGQDQQYRPIIKPTVMSEFTHQSHVTSCRTTQDNNAWISQLEDNGISRVDQTGAIKETVQCKVKVRRIAVSPTTGRVWFCCKDDRTIQEVKADNTIVTRIVTDREPISLCITTNNTVPVGMVGRIAMYTTAGREVESAGATNPCTQQARWPFNMAYCTKTGNIVVTDSVNVRCQDYIARKEPGKQPHITVMDNHLNVRFRYPSQDTPNVGTYGRGIRDEQRSLFYPRDVSFDETGNILVADEVLKSIILIDGYRGDFLCTVYTNDFTICGISFQKDGFLWIGMEKKKVKILKYN